MSGLIQLHRHLQAVRELARGANRLEGSGAGSGLFQGSPFFGAGGNQGGYSTANSSTFSDITNTSFTFNVGRPQLIEYRIYAAAHLTASSGLGYIRGNIVSYDVSANLEFGPTVTTNAFLYYQPLAAGKGMILPGTYTAKLQAATDNNTFSINVDQFFHQIIFLS